MSSRFDREDEVKADSGCLKEEYISILDIFRMPLTFFFPQKIASSIIVG